MGISDEIEVATITIDEETILEIKATIALPFQLSLTTFVVHGMTATKLAKSALHVQIFFFFFAYFLVSLVAVVEWSSLAALHCAKHAILDMRRFRQKNQRFDGKRPTKPTSVGTHTEAQICELFLLFP